MFFLNIALKLMLSAAHITKGKQKTYKINAVLLDSSKVSEKSNPLPLVIIGIETAAIIGMIITGFVLNKKGKLVITK